VSATLTVLKVMPGVDPCAGAEQSFAVTAPDLVDRGVRLHLVVFTERQGLVDQLERDGVVVHDLSGARSMQRRFRELVRVVRAVRPDLLHATLWDAVVPAQLAGWRTRTPVIATWASVGSFARGPAAAHSWKLRIVQYLNVALARLTRTEFHAVTVGVAEVNAAGLRVPAHRVHVVERGRRDVDASTGTEELEQLRAQLGLRVGRPVVLAVGRQEPVKNQVSLIRAVGLAREITGEEVQLLIAGREGLATPAVRRAAAGASFVHLLGHRDDVPVLIELADVVALSSLYEGAAGVAIEAMRASTPVVATDVVGQRGVLVDGVNALVVPVDDDRAMAAALASIATDHELGTQLGRAGRRTYEERFTIDKAVGGIHELYLRVAGSGARELAGGGHA
jgi:glycosyltransferase involved in cell wall biosynthesis